MLGFNDTSTLVGHFVSSPREREKRERRDSRGDERGIGKKEMKESETEEVTTPSLYPYLLQGEQALPNCKPISVGRSGDVEIRDTFASPNYHQVWRSTAQSTLLIIDIPFPQDFIVAESFS